MCSKSFVLIVITIATHSILTLTLELEFVTEDLCVFVCESLSYGIYTAICIAFGDLSGDGVDWSAALFIVLYHCCGLQQPWRRPKGRHRRTDFGRM